MLTTELKLQDWFKLEFKECYHGNGIVLEADITDYDKSLGELPDVAKKLYFRVGMGPYNYAFPANSGWGSPEPALDKGFPVPPPEVQITRPDNYVCWRLPQHERRLWQAGDPVYFGYYFKDNPVEFELDPKTAEILQKDFD
jgi:hypothetical protein